jgi:hypothetical protein
MSIRELLQTELWSKETSRKIGIKVGFVFCILAAALMGWFLLETRLITPGERSAGRKALTQVDALQNLDGISNEDFKAREKQAKLKIETAQRAALTVRDGGVYAALGSYLLMTEMGRDDVQNQREMQQLIERNRNSLKKADRDFAERLDLQLRHHSEEKLDSQQIDVTQFLRSTLHKELD